MSNMSTEWGTLAGVFPIDDITINWLKKRAEFIETRGLSGVPSDEDGKGIHPRINKMNIRALMQNPVNADSDAFYFKEVTIDLDTIEPYVAGPDNLKIMTPV